MQTPEETAKRFLLDSFTWINFDYDSLTPQERKLCTREEYEALTEWVRG